MIEKSIVNQIVEEYLGSKGFYLVDLKVNPDNRIIIEIDSMQGVSLDDCVELNRLIESKLDREEEDYELEVSSAGLSEPFKVINQYHKNTGKEVEVLLKTGKKISGVLKEVAEDYCVLEQELMVKPEGAKRKVATLETQNIPYQDIKTTKLIIRFK